jgi:hypothetical protein
VHFSQLGNALFLFGWTTLCCADGGMGALITLFICWATKMTDLIGKTAVIVGESPHAGEVVIIKAIGTEITVTPKYSKTFAEAYLPPDCVRLLPNNGEETLAQEVRDLLPKLWMG